MYLFPEFICKHAKFSFTQHLLLQTTLFNILLSYFKEGILRIVVFFPSSVTISSSKILIVFKILPLMCVYMEVWLANQITTLNVRMVEASKGY